MSEKTRPEKTKATKLSRVAAEKAILELMKAAGQEPDLDLARSIVAARGGPKGADMDRGMVYFMPGSQSNSGEDELFLTFSKKAYGRDQWYNGAACLTATERSDEFELVDAAKACGAENIRSVSLGTAVLTLAEANEILLEAAHEKMAEAEDDTSGEPDNLDDGILDVE